MYKINLKQNYRLWKNKAFDGKCINEYKFIYFNPPYLQKKFGRSF